jgi:hypothetical protein
MHSNNSADDNENENQLEQEMQEEGAALSPTAVQKKGDTLQLVTLLPSANEEFVDRDLLYCKQHFWGVSTKTAGVAKQDMSREEMARIKFQQFVTQLLESKALKVLASCFSGGAPSSVVSTAAAPFFSSSLETVKVVATLVVAHSDDSGSTIFVFFINTCVAIVALNAAGICQREMALFATTGTTVLIACDGNGRGRGRVLIVATMVIIITVMRDVPLVM